MEVRGSEIGSLGFISEKPASQPGKETLLAFFETANHSRYTFRASI